jgi:hypothetical protein
VGESVNKKYRDILFTLEEVKVDRIMDKTSHLLPAVTCYGDTGCMNKEDQDTICGMNEWHMFLNGKLFASTALGR